MKRTIILCMLVAVLLVATMPVVAQDAHTGQTLMIGGLVPLILDLVLDPHTQAQDLPLVGAGSKTQEIAELTITTNNTGGWELWAYSVNGSELLNPDGDSIGYTIRYGDGVGENGEDGEDIPEGQGSGSGGDPATGVLIGSGDAANEPEDGYLGETGNLYIIYTQQNNFRAGYYSDQIAIVLRAQ